MFDDSRTENRAEREPWIAASLSWLVPGAGHLYIHYWTRAVSFLGLAAGLSALSLACLTSPLLSPLWLLPLKVCAAVLLPISAALSAYRDAARGNAQDFEKDRRLAKDPWLAVFLSLLLPGAGHAYLLKGGLALIAMAAFITLYILSSYHGYVFTLQLIVYVLVCIHAYSVCQIHRRTRGRTMALMVLLIVLVQLSANVALPQLYSRLVFTMCPVGSPSMSPILKVGDEAIMSKRAYWLRPPRAGDVVEFSIAGTSAGDFEHLAKRIVAVGGETVQIKNGRILINGKERDLKVPRNLGLQYPGEIAIDQHAGDENLLLAFGVDQPLRIPEEHYFVLGDNLSYSMDSRCFGPVPRQSIEGRIVKILWPLRRIGNVR